MKKLKVSFLIISLLITSLTSCTSPKKAVQDDDFATESDLELDDTGDASAGSDELDFDGDSTAATAPGSTEVDEFAEFENPQATANSDASVPGNPESDLEDELNQLDGSTSLDQASVPPPVDEFVPEPEIPSTDTVMTEPTIQPLIDQSAPATLAEISSLRYQSNENGGAIVIDSTQPIQFTTRLNSATNQLVVEIQNSIVPKKLKRNLNTKDMASSIGSVDVYQKPNSKISRFVVQLRPGAPEPLVQPEGNSLLIVGAATAGSADADGDQGSTSVAATGQDSISETPTGTQDVNADLTGAGILGSQNLEDFLASNNKFYGKKISLEANKLDLREAFSFLAEESNINMIIDDAVGGDVSIKLKQVPWDQAFVLILKAKKLGYKRQGNVLRIATVDTLIKEEEDALKLIETRRSKEPTIVKRFFISYADITDLTTKIREFIANTTTGITPGAAATAAQGRVISDKRTSSLIVTDIPSNMVKIEKLIQAIDTQPKQVLIEGKVVEAQERFARGLGVDWASGARDLPTGAIIQPSTNFSSRDFAIPTSFVGSIAVGKLGGAGSLDASLRLGERESKIRVLSSPRISVLSNETANISQTVTIQIPRSSTTSTTGTQTTFETAQAGVRLSVIPQIANEGTVVMDLTISRSFVSDATSAAIESRDAKTKVIVRSGQTAVIGGIFQADSTESSGGIPFFRNIPLLGYAFGGRTVNKSKNELVIFVTPKIQKPLQADSPASTSFE